MQMLIAIDCTVTVRMSSSKCTGEMVLIHQDFLSMETPRDQKFVKVAPRWLGPFKIARVPNMVTVKV